MKTLQEFQKTGKFIIREDFEDKYATTPPLQPDCTDVLLYWGAFYIECLKSNTFLLDIRDTSTGDVITRVKHPRLEVVESILWDRHVEKLINKKNEN